MNVRFGHQIEKELTNEGFSRIDVPRWRLEQPVLWMLLMSIVVGLALPTVVVLVSLNVITPDATSIHLGTMPTLFVMTLGVLFVGVLIAFLGRAYLARETLWAMPERLLHSVCLFRLCILRGAELSAIQTLRFAPQASLDRREGGVLEDMIVKPSLLAAEIVTLGRPGPHLFFNDGQSTIMIGCGLSHKEARRILGDVEDASGIQVAEAHPS